MTERSSDVIAAYISELLFEADPLMEEGGHDERLVQQLSDKSIESAQQKKSAARNITPAQTITSAQTITPAPAVKSIAASSALATVAINSRYSLQVKDAQAFLPAQLSQSVQLETRRHNTTTHDDQNPLQSLAAQKREQLERLLQSSLKISEPVVHVDTLELAIEPLMVDPLKTDPLKTAPVKIAEPKANVSALSQPLKTKPAEGKNQTAKIASPPPKQPSNLQSAEGDVAQTEVFTPVNPLLEWAENGRPVWAARKFDVLLFRVSGLTLAVPLIALGHIHPLTEELTPIFGQANWFMGLQPSQNGQIRCVNTALFVMPERYNPNFLTTAKFVISLHGTHWGLAVDSVQQPTSINPDEVTWRGDRSKRPWLAGTVKAAMCALIDVPRMGDLLQQSDVKRK